MSALLRKEIRLLLPSSVIALLLAGSFWLVPRETGLDPGDRESLAALGFLLCPVMMVVMALSSFGREISAGTLPELLCQPISRERVWWTKTILLGLALACVATVWRWSFLHYLAGFDYEGLKPEALGTLSLVLVAYSGGLWTVLLLRQVGVAFWFTLLVPGFLVAMVSRQTEHHPEKTEFALAVVLIPYALAGFWWARRLFLRAEDYHWTGGTITMPAVGGWWSVFGWRASRRQFRPRAALLAKEIQLHQSQLLIAGLLAVLHLGVLAARKLGAGPEPTPFLDMVADHFWVLWLVMPVLVGCAAVAEERKLGTLEAQLCLPVKRRTQLVLKLAVALLVSLLLGAVAPVLLEGRKLLPETDWKSYPQELANELLQEPGGDVFQPVLIAEEALRSVLSPILPFLPMLAGAAGLLVVALYASTLARSMLQALALAALGIVASGLSFGFLVQMEYLVRHPPWRGGLVFLLGVPVVLLLLARLTCWNFQHALVGWPVWRRNGLVWLGSLAVVGLTTTALYHRVWEWTGPLEPPHGRAVLAPSQGVSLSSDGWNLLARLPDGQTWMGRFCPTFPSVGSLLTGDMKMSSVLGAGRYLEGSNWATAVACRYDVFGIKRDGTLWVSEEPERWRRSWWPLTNLNLVPIPMVRIGQDTNWLQAVGVRPHVFLLKTDGTLWQWGSGPFDRRKGWPGLQAFQPERVGTDSDWAEISLNQEHWEFRKKDGHIWVKFYESRSTRTPGAIRLDDSSVLAPSRQEPEHRRWRGLAWYEGWRYARSKFCQVGVQEDGTLRLRASADIRLDGGSNWLMVVAHRDCESLVTLKADGTLWEWDLPGRWADPITARTTRLGRHSDWVALCSYRHGLATLAADGSLWFWPSDPQYYAPPDLPLPPLLGPSRRPQPIGNILGRAP
jgi:ABC-type transport system involved in multi-copper enzyme maturation permease subunit